jgi:imidazolonepropionase-like amidohydrolase
MSSVALLNGTLLDGVGNEPHEKWGVVFQEGRVAAVGPVDDLRYDPGSEVVDLDGRTVMPGIIDSHTHLTYHSSQPDLMQMELQESIEFNTALAVANAAAILDMGVTTIGDGGCRGYIGPAIRDAVAAGVIRGPRVVSCGPIICGVAGLDDKMPPWVHAESDTALGMIVSGREEVRRAVREQVRGGVDWIKVSASGVAGARYLTAQDPDLNAEEVSAAVAEARKFGRPVHAHAHSSEAIATAASAGVISLHSGEFATQESLEIMREHQTVFVPTIAWLHARTLPGYPFSANPEFFQEAEEAFLACARAIPAAKELGVLVGLGTDASHRFHHSPDAVLEMLFLQELGMSPMEVIVASTRTAAAAINRSDQLGTLEVGKMADALVVDGEPQTDISVLRDKTNITEVYIAGAKQEFHGAGVLGEDVDVRSIVKESLERV